MYLFQHSEKMFSLGEIGSEEGPAPKPSLVTSRLPQQFEWKMLTCLQKLQTIYTFKRVMQFPEIHYSQNFFEC